MRHRLPLSPPSTHGATMAYLIAYYYHIAVFAMTDAEAGWLSDCNVPGPWCSTAVVNQGCAVRSLEWQLLEYVIEIVVLLSHALYEMRYLKPRVQPCVGALPSRIADNDRPASSERSRWR